MSPQARDFRPPQPQGEPYRADPSDPAPFTHQDELPASGPPVYAQPVQSPSMQAPPTYGDRPQFQQPLPVRIELTPDQKFARVAVWTGGVSIFVFNLVLGPVAVVMGVMAMRRGERKQGRLAIILGVAGTLVGVLLLVLVAVGVLPDVDQMLKDLRTQK